MTVSPLNWREREPAPLPAPLTPLLGRDAEVAAVCALLRGEHPRLVTLTGPGGVGKTRLALRVAEEAGDDPSLRSEPAPTEGRGQAFADGVAFVALAPLGEPDAVVSAIAAQLGVREGGDRSLDERLQTFLRHKRVLLVLDNFEHVLAAAPLVAALLAGCRQLKVLVTSRARLGLSGEHVFLVPPLGVPPLSGASRDVSRETGARSLDSPLSTLDSYPAVRLFVERARAVRSGFALTPANAAAVAEICRRVDGLPLGLELAAARVAALSPDQLLARLEPSLPVLVGGARDLPARQQTLRDTIAWSYDLLTDAEQALFRRLSVFAGGFTLEAAEAIAEGTAGRQDGGTAGESVPAVLPSRPPAVSVLDGLASLVDKSLLRRDDDAAAQGGLRYSMLETIREFALERLAASGEEDEARRGHAAWCTAVAEEMTRRINEPGHAAWWARLYAEQANLHAALAWLEDRGEPDALLRLAASLWRFWRHDNRLAEGRRWLVRALAAGRQASPRLRVEVLIGAAMLAHFQGDDESAAAACDEALVLCRQLDARSRVAFVRCLQGMLDEDAGRYAAAEPAFAEALALFEAEGDPSWVGLCRMHLGVTAYGRGDLATARAYLEAALAATRTTGHPWTASNALLYLGQVDLMDGDLPAARAALAEALALSAALGSPRSIAIDLIATAGALGVATGQAERGARLLAWAEAERSSAGAAARLPERACYERAAAQSRATLGPEAFAAADEAGKALPLEEAVAEAADVAAEPLEIAGVAGTVVAAPADKVAGLTPRQVEVLRLLAAGRADKEIAAALGISRHTVGHHVADILATLGVESRAAAAAHAARHGLA